MKEFDFEKTPIVEIANEILLDGVKRGASDIHFDPYKNGLAIRMRVDGVLYDYSSVPPEYKRNMISRIKMISSMNIMETRLPQDGAIKSKIGDKTLDLRVSSLPCHNGEKVVLRILDYSKSLQGLETLGFSQSNLEKIIKMIEMPNGIVLVTGATGSGKSTTVYSILQKLNTREVNIITVEDPVEMEVEGLNQVQAQSEIGLDFAAVLRSILRQDPDIIMIGEIRDGETARIAVRASITGHKVLSTIHTNSALNTIERLTDMEVERYLIGTSLNGIISQKLARKLCPHCRIAREPNDYEKSLFKTVSHKEIDKVYDVNPEGCEHCFKGYRNRIAIAEVLVITDEIRSAITTAEPKDVMRKLVYYDGHTHTLLEDGLEKIALGETNFDEIFKLVDLENDLAIAKAIYDEIENDKKKEKESGSKTILDDLAEKTSVKEETPEEVKDVAPQEVKAAPKVEEDTILTEDNVSTLEESQKPNVEVKSEETVTITPPVETSTISSPAQTIELLDETNKQEDNSVVEIQSEASTPTPAPQNNEVQSIVEIKPSQPETIEILDEDNKIETLDTDKSTEVLETLDNTISELKTTNDNAGDYLAPPVLNNPLTNESVPITNTTQPQANVNYDQITKVPFVDETLDL